MRLFNAAFSSQISSFFLSTDWNHATLVYPSLNNNFSVVETLLADAWLYNFLTLYSVHTQDKLILILINVQYLQNIIFRFKKGLNDQIHSPSVDSHNPAKRFPPKLDKVKQSKTKIL